MEWRISTVFLPFTERFVIEDCSVIDPLLLNQFPDHISDDVSWGTDLCKVPRLCLIQIFPFT